MGWFRRRPAGRHAVGAAVTGLPSGPPTPPLAPALPPAAAEPPSPAPDVTAGPRVQLGFRDGSQALLDPASSQARALEALARDLRG